MLKIFLLLLILGTGEITTLGAMTTMPTTTQNRATKVLIMGDSTTTGYPFELENGSWTSHLSPISHLSFTVIAHNGITLKDLLPLAKEAIASGDYPYIFVMIGLNEAMYGDSSFSFNYNLAKLKDLCRKAKAKLLVAYPIALHSVEGAKYHQNWLAMQKNLRKFTSRYHLSYVDANILSDAELVDVCHPSLAGYNKLGELFYNFFSKLS